MSTTTSSEIRDRIAEVVEALTPSVYPEIAFVPYLDDAGADFRRWARSALPRQDWRPWHWPLRRRGRSAQARPPWRCCVTGTAA